MDAAGQQSCRVQSESVKNESKGLQKTGLPATHGPELNGPDSETVLILKQYTMMEEYSYLSESKNARGLHH